MATNIIYQHKHVAKTLVGNKGNGFVATRDIKKFTILVIDSSIIPKLEVNDENKEMMIMYFLLMLPNDKKILFEMLTPHISSEVTISNSDIKEKIGNVKNNKIRNVLIRNIDKVKLYLEKYKRNAFNLDNIESTINPGILVNGAIFNHNCDPNVSFTCEDSKMYFFSNRDIKKGEELCDSYVDVSLCSKKRRAMLKERYDFVCNCNTCTTDCISQRYKELKSNRKISTDMLLKN
jgi:hypothetical protein